MKTIRLLFIIVAAVLLSVIAQAHEEDDARSGREPDPPAKFELTRQGHLDVMAKTRTLTWKVVEPETIETLDVQIVKIAEGSMKPETLFRSKKPAGRVDLAEFNKGPGLYAILAQSTDRSGQSVKQGMRFSFTALNPDCPNEKAWWPSKETVDFQSGRGDRSEKLYEYSPRNLLHLARRASHIVRGVVADLVPCPTKEGSLFTYVIFDDVQSVAREGDSKTPEQLILRIPGGMAHGRVEIVTDAPIFRRGDQVLLFLTRNPQSQVPIVGGAEGVVLIEKGGQIRSYWGPGIVGVNDEFGIELDPGYQPNSAHLRHYDPNMRAVIDDPKPARGINKAARKGRPKSRPAMSLDEFSETLEKVWARADEMGRLPIEIDTSPRPAYNELSGRQKKG